MPNFLPLRLRPLGNLWMPPGPFDSMRECLPPGHQTRSQRGRVVQLRTLPPLRPRGTLRGRRIVRVGRCCSNVHVPEAGGYLHGGRHLSDWLCVAIRIEFPRVPMLESVKGIFWLSSGAMLTGRPKASKSKNILIDLFEQITIFPSSVSPLALADLLALTLYSCII